MKRMPVDHLDPTIKLLRRMLAGASGTLLGFGALACGEDGVASYAGRPYCVDGVWVPTSNLALSHPVDYVSLRSTSDQNVTILSASGLLCAHAEDVRVCEAEVDRVSQKDVTSDGSSYLLTTEGALVEAYQTLAQKLVLLGAIDTADEALLLASSAGHAVGCEAQVGREPGGWGISYRTAQCGAPDAQTQLHVAANGEVEVVLHLEEPSDCVDGRTPPGLVRRRRVHGPSLGQRLARASHDERASVDAFEILARELRMHGAPQALYEAVRVAAEDEVRHARDTARLAERFGARPAPVHMRKVALRSVAEIAIDNALEGCVNESHAAFLAQRRAARASDAELRRVYGVIAEEEARHAALSFQLGAWLEPQLDPATRARIRSARLHAISRLGQNAA